MEQNIAVNRSERIRLRGFREGKTKGWQHQVKLQALSFEAIQDTSEWVSVE